VVSPQIDADGRVTFRLLAPNATTVTVGGDINGSMVPDPTAPPPQPAEPAGRGGRGAGTPAVTMVKGENGVWSGTTLRRVKPGAWRYTFNVDGTTVVDLRNVNVSPNQTQVQSVLYVPGDDFSETRDVAHGTVGLVRYVAKTLGNARREMYVYTPPAMRKVPAGCRRCI
jgi:enterochelin esterase family protein